MSFALQLSVVWIRRAQGREECGCVGPTVRYGGQAERAVGQQPSAHEPTPAARVAFLIPGDGGFLCRPVEGESLADAQCGLRLCDLKALAACLRNTGPATQEDADWLAVLEAAVERYGRLGVRPVFATASLQHC
jgi:hypothetical protein